MAPADEDGLLHIEVVYSPAPRVVEQVAAAIARRQHRRTGAARERFARAPRADGRRAARGGCVGQARRARRCAARRRSCRGLPAAARRPEGSEAPALPRAPRALSAQALNHGVGRCEPQSDAMTWRARWISAARALSSRISRSPFSLARARRMPSSSERNWLLRTRAVLGTRVRALLSSDAFCLAFCSSSALRLRASTSVSSGLGGAAATADAKACGADAAAARRATDRARPLQDVLLGNVARRRCVAHRDAAGRIAPLPLRHCIGRGSDADQCNKHPSETQTGCNDRVIFHGRKV